MEGLEGWHASPLRRLGRCLRAGGLPSWVYKSPSRPSVAVPLIFYLSPLARLLALSPTLAMANTVVLGTYRSVT